jgi:L-ribulose-5-phosphate 3-epimerase
MLESIELTPLAVACPMRRGLDVPDNLERRIDYLREAMTLSFDLGARSIVISAGQIPEKEDDPRRQWLFESLETLGRHGDRVGTSVLLETGLESAETMLSLLDRIDAGSLGVCFNPGNLMLHGFNPYHSARTLKTRLRYVHARDARMASAGRLAQDVPLGHGDIDWLQMLGLFEEIEYRGGITIEREASADASTHLAAAVGFLKRLIG